MILDLSPEVVIFETNSISFEKRKIYSNYLEKLTNDVKSKKAQVIYVTQTSGHGMNQTLYTISKIIMSHCKENQLICINLARNSNLKFDDFYDGLHLNKKGSLKAGNYIYNELLKTLEIN